MVELLAVIAIIVLLAALLLPALARARREVQKTVCLSNQRQGMIAMMSYAGDWSEFPWVLDWSNVRTNDDLAVNTGTNISDNKPGGLTTQAAWGNSAWGLPTWVLLRQKGYISSYKAVQCSVPFQSDRPYYNRHINATTTARGYLFSVLSPDSSLYCVYENGCGTSLAMRNHGSNPFDLYTDSTKRRSTSLRGWSFRDQRVAATFAWTICPGRFESQTWSDPARPGSTFGGYAYEPHGTQPLSCLDPCWGGPTWADYWGVNNTHFVERAVGYADGHAVYDHQVTPHIAGGCPEKLP